jgi:hypothetical protein
VVQLALEVIAEISTDSTKSLPVGDNGVSPVDEIFSKFMVDLLALFSFVLVVCVLVVCL